MNPSDPLEHFDLCSNCGSVILGRGECRACPVETVQVPGFLIFGIVGILWILVAILLVNVYLLIGYLGWGHYFSEFIYFLKGGK